MKLDLPFYENKGDGQQCMQVAMQIVLKHFLDKEFSLEELDLLTKRKEGKWTWTPQIVSVLYDNGLDLKYYSKIDITKFSGGETFIRERYGADAEKILSYTDIPILLFSIKEMMNYDLVSTDVPSFKEIENHISQGHVPMILIDYNILEGVEGSYQGHFIVVTGVDDEFVYYHESGPGNAEPNRKVSKQKFIDAWNANGTDNDVVIVFGKR